MPDKAQKAIGHKPKGFTMIELLVVLALLGAMSAIAVPQLWGQYTAIKERKNIESFWSKVKASSTLYHQSGENFVFHYDDEQWSIIAKEFSLIIESSDRIISRADGFVRGGEIILKTVDRSNLWVIMVKTPDGAVSIERR